MLEVVRFAASLFSDEELNLLSAVAGQMAVAIQKSERTAEAERLARQMAVLYDLALETTALRDLRPLFIKAAEETGRLIHADHTSVLRYDPADGWLKVFAAWARDSAGERYASPIFRMGEGVAGRVAMDRLPAMVNEPGERPDFVERLNPVARLMCVPLVYYEKDEPALFGVLNATRRPGAPPFVQEDLEYLTRFAGQLSIAVANSMAFAAERERSEQIAVVNARHARDQRHPVPRAHPGDGGQPHPRGLPVPGRHHHRGRPRRQRIPHRRGGDAATGGRSAGASP